MMTRQYSLSKERHDQMLIHLKRRFKELEFKTRGRVFWKSTSNGILVFEFTYYKYGFPLGDLQFGVGYGIDEMYQAFPDFHQQGSTPRVKDCQVTLDLGWFNKHHAPAKLAIRENTGTASGRGRRAESLSWNIRLPKFEDSQIHQIDHLIFDVAVPEVLRWDDRKRLVSALTKSGAEAGFKWVLDALRSLEQGRPPRAPVLGEIARRFIPD